MPQSKEALKASLLSLPDLLEVIASAEDDGVAYIPIGIGAAVAHNLAAKGCSVVIHYNSSSSGKDAQQLAETLRADYKVECIVLQADLSADSGPEGFVMAVKDEWTKTHSSFQIDILINNAGMVHNAILGEINAADFHKVYRINTLAPLLTMQAVMPHLPHDRSGRVVNVSSVSSTTGFVDQSIYGGSKAALEACTKSWARQLAERCTVNAVNPGKLPSLCFEHNIVTYCRARQD
jgi:3-oxoacyl-[acyl-carrier protein] reductase